MRSCAYRFGFNGQEKVNEIAGIGNHNTALFWEYDTRLGRRWNLDPVVKEWESGYATFGNNPIFFIDILGDDKDKNGTPQPTTDKKETHSADGSGYSGEAAPPTEMKEVTIKGKRTPIEQTQAKVAAKGDMASMNTSSNPIIDPYPMGRISTHTPSATENWQNSTSIGGKFTYGIANDLYLASQIFTQSFNGGNYYNLGGGIPSYKERVGGALNGLSLFVPIANSERVAANVVDISMRSLSLKLHPRLTNIGIEGIGKGQFDIAHRASAFFQKDIMSNGTFGFKNWKTFYYNHTIGNTNFSIGINPWKREIFHSGIGVFK